MNLWFSNVQTRGEAVFAYTTEGRRFSALSKGDLAGSDRGGEHAQLLKIRLEVQAVRTGTPFVNNATADLRLGELDGTAPYDTRHYLSRIQDVDYLVSIARETLFSYWFGDHRHVSHIKRINHHFISDHISR